MATKWSKIIRDNIDSIKEAAVKAYKKAAYCDLSGWHYDIEIDQNGDVSVCGPLSQGSQSGESWNGDSCIVVRVRQWTPELNERECMEGTDYKDEYRNSDYSSEYEFMSEKYPDVLAEWKDDLVDVLAHEYGESRELADAIEFAIQEAEREEANQEAQEEFDRHFRA
jgi:hypothetical protein